MSIHRIIEKSARSGGRYDTAQICMNGHVINGHAESSPEFNQSFCTRCGTKTITACPDCQTRIPGEYDFEGIISSGRLPTPEFCFNCGAPYPWTEKRKENIRELIDQMTELGAGDRITLHDAIDDLMRDTPRSPVAVVQIRKIIPKIEKTANENLRKLVSEGMSEEIRKQLWGR